MSIPQFHQMLNHMNDHEFAEFLDKIHKTLSKSSRTFHIYELFVIHSSSAAAMAVSVKDIMALTGTATRQTTYNALHLLEDYYLITELKTDAGKVYTFSPSILLNNVQNKIIGHKSEWLLPITFLPRNGNQKLVYGKRLFTINTHINKSELDHLKNFRDKMNKYNNHPQELGSC